MPQFPAWTDPLAAWTTAVQVVEDDCVCRLLVWWTV